MNLTARFTSVLSIGLALACSASLSTASTDTDPMKNKARASAADPAIGNAVGFAEVTIPASRGSIPQSRPDISGRWTLNVSLSDRPKEMLKTAMQARKRTVANGRGKGGGSDDERSGSGMGFNSGRQGRGGGKGGGGRGHGSPGEMGGDNEMSSHEMSVLVAAAEKLDITHEGARVIMTDENERRQVLVPDSRGLSVSASGGMQQRLTVAIWQGPSLVVETSLRSGSRLVQDYQIDAKTGQLVIFAAASLSEMQPVSYRLVYDRLILETNETDTDNITIR